MRTVLATALLCAAAFQSVAAQDDRPVRRRTRSDGVHIRIGRDYHLPADQVLARPVVVVGGAATVDGLVAADLVVIGGAVRIGPTARITADIVAVGGEIQVADGAQVSGEIRDVSVIWPELRFAMRDWLWAIDEGWWAVFSLVGSMFRLALIMVAACLLALLAPGWIRRIERTATGAPLAAGILGLTIEVMFVPLLVITVVGLILTIVGIPLLALVPFALVTFALAWVAGFAGVAAQIGGRLRGRGHATIDSPVLDTAVGVALIGAVTLTGSLLALAPFMAPLAAAFKAAGLIIEYVAWTIGLGAALLAPFRNRWHQTPPPLPRPASAPAAA